nr:serine hydrolase [Caballeronia insecticola]
MFAIDTASKRTPSYRADERFLMCSTFKGILAAQVLARVDRAEEWLDRLVRYSKKDLTLLYLSPTRTSREARCQSETSGAPSSKAATIQRPCC